MDTNQRNKRQLLIISSMKGVDVCYSSLTKKDGGSSPGWTIELLPELINNQLVETNERLEHIQVKRWLPAPNCYDKGQLSITSFNN